MKAPSTMVLIFLSLSSPAYANHPQMELYQYSTPFIIAILITLLALKLLKTKFKMLLLSIIFITTLLISSLINYVVYM